MIGLTGGYMRPTSTPFSLDQHFIKPRGLAKRRPVHRAVTCKSPPAFFSSCWSLLRSWLSPTSCSIVVAFVIWPERSSPSSSSWLRCQECISPRTFFTSASWVSSSASAFPRQLASQGSPIKFRGWRRAPGLPLHAPWLLLSLQFTGCISSSMEIHLHRFTWFVSSDLLILLIFNLFLF